MTRPEAMRLARQMYGDGDAWSYEAIRKYLAEHGLTVSWTTVKRWANPEADAAARARYAAAARRKYREQNGLNIARVADSDAVARRALTLLDSGCDARNTRIVLMVDYGIRVSGQSLTHLQTTGQFPERLVRLIDKKLLVES